MSVLTEGESVSVLERRQRCGTIYKFLRTDKLYCRFRTCIDVSSKVIQRFQVVVFGKVATYGDCPRIIGRSRFEPDDIILFHVKLLDTFVAIFGIFPDR